MDREEILKRSRAEKEDEGRNFLENQGRRLGVAGFLYHVHRAFGVQCDYRTILPQHPSPVLVLRLYGGLGKYRLSRERLFLTTAALTAVSSLRFLSCHVLEVLR